MPLFSRLRDEILLHREQCPPSGDFVMSRRFLSKTDANHYNLMKEAIARTEHELWPKVRQNLRSSCENDLLNQVFQEGLVTLWLGHTVAVSRGHYQTQTDAAYRRAVEQQVD